MRYVRTSFSLPQAASTLAALPRVLVYVRARLANGSSGLSKTALLASKTGLGQAHRVASQTHALPKSCFGHSSQHRRELIRGAAA